MKQAQYKQDDFWKSVSVPQRGERLYQAINGLPIALRR